MSVHVILPYLVRIIIPYESELIPPGIPPKNALEDSPFTIA